MKISSPSSKQKRIDSECYIKIIHFSRIFAGILLGCACICFASMQHHCIAARAVPSAHRSRASSGDIACAEALEPTAATMDWVNFAFPHPPLSGFPARLRELTLRDQHRKSFSVVECRESQESSSLVKERTLSSHQI